jgi:hypothetical protein
MKPCALRGCGNAAPQAVNDEIAAASQPVCDRDVHRHGTELVLDREPWFPYKHAAHVQQGSRALMAKLPIAGGHLGDGAL